MKVTLVIATINRYEEVDNLLKSIESLDYPKNNIEIIIVDQNLKKDLTEIIKKYFSLDIKHIKSREKGLSKNRNLGIEKSTGEIICFPDDDCKFLKNTLKNVVEKFKKNPNIYAFLGKIIDEKGEDCIRKWPVKSETINLKNFYLKNTSITLFKRNDIKNYFDENFGVGSKYGACEDADFLYRILKRGLLVQYNPNIILFHPNFKNRISKEKSYNYGIGFGAFCKKNKDLNIIILFFKSTIWFLIRSIIYFIKIDFSSAKVMIYGLKGRIYGYIFYKNL